LLSHTDALIALHRFGFGPKPGEVAQVAADPKGWLEQQIELPYSPPPAMSGLPLAAENVIDWWVTARRSVPDLVRKYRTEYKSLWLEEVKARLKEAVVTDTPFRERLVWFWSNHFTVSGVVGRTMGMVGAHERDAIRPNIFGSFRDLLHASTRHPGMLFYLDNHLSMGGKSAAGVYSGRGLNENLARELMELHTLGVDQGYNQDDVHNLAKMLTGWTFARQNEPAPGGFYFRSSYHEPGNKMLMGQEYAEQGEAEATQVLDRLAQEPATARRIAFKLARHFIADEPPPPMVDHLETVYRDTGGDLRALSYALINRPEAWDTQLHKAKSHQEYVVGVARLTADTVSVATLIEVLENFGQVPFMAPSPAGWPDVSATWIAPDSALRRARFALAIADQVADKIDVPALISETADGLAPPEAVNTMRQAATAQESLALLLASPTMQRR
jgi:uncharacterized protein (DUF1800 family)